MKILCGFSTPKFNHIKIYEFWNEIRPFFGIPDPDPTIFWYPGSDRHLSRIRIPDPGPTNKKRETLN
jgi:hypothetical protein